MKKISLVLGMLLAVGLLATSCKQPSAPDLSKEDLTETDWLVGTWEVTTEYNMDVSYDGDVPEEVKKALEENFKMPKSETITRTITAETAPAFKAELESYIAMAEAGETTKTQDETTVNGFKVTLSATLKQTFSKK